MKRIAIYILLIAPYVFISGGAHREVSDMNFVVPLSALGLLCGLNMVNALTTPRHGAKAETYLFWCMVLKLAFVPLYGICCHMLVSNEVAITSASIVMFSLLGGFILILTTTSYGWRGLWVAHQGGLVSRRFALGHALLQMLYVLDVVSSVYCYFRVKGAQRNADEENIG